VHDFIRSFIATIHNAIDPREYPFRRDKEDFLLFVGLIAPHKGVHYAIQVAKRLGMKLLIAGKLEPMYMSYFEECVKPQLGDDVVYLGEVSESEKRRLMAGAKCLLFASTYEEPFGVVMIEALACGTPVVAFNNGATREIIKNGEVGFLVETVDEMCHAVERAIAEVEPLDCRRYVEENFAISIAAERHLEVYRKAMELYEQRVKPITVLPVFNEEPRPRVLAGHDDFG